MPVLPTPTTVKSVEQHEHLVLHDRRVDRRRDDHPVPGGRSRAAAAVAARARAERHQLAVGHPRPRPHPPGTGPEPARPRRDRPAVGGDAPGSDLTPFVADVPRHPRRRAAARRGRALRRRGDRAAAGPGRPAAHPTADPGRQRRPRPRGPPPARPGHPADHRRTGHHDQPHARRRPGPHHHVHGDAVRPTLAGRPPSSSPSTTPSAAAPASSRPPPRWPAPCSAPPGNARSCSTSLPTLTTPTLVIWGGCDYVLPAHQAQTAVNLLPTGGSRCSPTADTCPTSSTPTGSPPCSATGSPNTTTSPTAQRRPRHGPRYRCRVHHGEPDRRTA